MPRSAVLQLISPRLKHACCVTHGPVRIVLFANQEGSFIEQVVAVR